MKKIICALACVAALIGCGHKTQQATEPVAMPKKAPAPTFIQVDDGGVHAQLPLDFKQSKNHMWISMERNILFIVINQMTEDSLDDFVNNNIHDLTQMDPTVEVVKNQKINVHGKEGDLLLIRNDKIYVANIIVVEKGMVHMVGCGSTLNKADETLPVCADILDSVHVE